MLKKGDGIPKNYIEAKYYIKKSADNGNNEAALEYAKMLLSEKPNKEMIITTLKEAGDKGDLKAMYYAGVLFATNDGEPYDLGEAAKYYKKAADLGYPDSMFSFG